MRHPRGLLEEEPGELTLVRDAELEAAHSLRRAPDGSVGQRRVPRWWLMPLGATVVASWWLVLSRGRGGFELSELAGNLAVFLQRLSGSTTAGVPAFQQAGRLLDAGRLAVDTVVMSVIAAGVAGGVALVTISFASYRLTSGQLAVVPGAAGWIVRSVTRGVHVVTRSIPEYLWALIVVFILQAGILAGAVAIALHNIGVMGRLGADIIDDLDAAPLMALRSSGASTLQILFYGIVPQVLPQLLTFLLYRWEVMIRASAVVGFVTAAGLGYALRLALARFDYTGIVVLLAAYVLMTFAVDLISNGLRRLAR